jgi:hypothetical protein
MLAYQASSKVAKVGSERMHDNQLNLDSTSVLQPTE